MTKYIFNKDLVEKCVISVDEAQTFYKEGTPFVQHVPDHSWVTVGHRHEGRILITHSMSLDEFQKLYEGEYIPEVSPPIRYCLHGDYVISADGDRHYISAEKLISLYGLRREECVLVPRNTRGWRIPEGCISLYPESNGYYSLPERICLKKKSL